MKTRTHTVLAALALAALSSTLAGCFNPFDPRIAAGVGISKPKPEPTSATGVIELFQWCWVNRSISEYREIFTDDYVFTFALLDTAGNTYRERPWRREDELISAENLFVTGKASEEPASSITLDFGNTLFALPDTRPGKNPRWHKQINVGVVLVVKRASSDFEVKGDARFFVVRGDSAKIPEDTGLSPDETRWYIEGWEDNTIQNQGQLARLRPATGRDAAGVPMPADLAPLVIPMSWGRAKVIYR